MKEYEVETVIAIAEIIDPAFIGADIIRQAAKIANLVTSEDFAERMEYRTERTPSQKEYEKVPPRIKVRPLIKERIKEPVNYFDSHDPIDQLREFLKREKISMSKAAKAMGLSTSSVAFWLQGKWKPGRKSIAKIKKYLS